jgi:hypothetical protein
MIYRVREHDLYECNDARCRICLSRENEYDCGRYYTGCTGCGKTTCVCPEDGPDQDGGSDV